MRVYSWSWNTKTKSFILRWYFKILFTSFINALFTDQHSSGEIKPQALTSILLDFFRKIDSILMIWSAISWEESIEYYWFPTELQYFSWTSVKVNRWLAIEHFRRDLLQCLSSTHLSGLNSHSIHLSIYLGLLWWSLPAEVI